MTLGKNSTNRQPILTATDLVLQTDALADDMFYAQTGTNQLDIPTSLVIEAEVRYVSGESIRTGRPQAGIGFITVPYSVAGLFCIESNNIFLSRDQQIRGPEASVDTTSAFHTCRIEVDNATSAGGTIRVYWDRVLKLTDALQGSGYNVVGDSEIWFGDGTGWASGVSRWRSFRHNAARQSAHTASLVSWWKGQDNANDAVGNNHGTLDSGAGFAPSRYGQGFSFNGVAGHVSISHSPSLRQGTNSFSLAAWIITTNGIGWRNIISQYEGSGSSFGYGYYGGAVVDGKLRFDLRDSDRDGDPAPDVGGGQKLVGTHDVADGAFHHVAFVRDVEHGEMRIYLDGALEASAALNAGATGTIQDDDGEDDLVIIGAARITYLTTVGGIFDGIIDEVQYYAGALSAQQVRDAAAGAQSIYSYDASLGTLPEAQGFTRFQTAGFTEPALSGGALHQYANDPVGYQFWYASTGHFDFSTNSYALEATLRVISAKDVEPGNLGYQFEAIDSVGRQVVVTIGTNAVNVYGGTSSSPAVPFNATDGFHTYRVEIANGAAALFIDSNQVASAPLDPPQHPEEPYPNRVYFGDGGGFGASEVELRQLNFARVLDVSPVPRGIKESVLAELIALRSTVTNRNDGRRLDDAIAHLTKSLAAKLWVDEFHLERKRGDIVFYQEKLAGRTLCNLIQSGKSHIPDTVLQGFVDRIFQADRLLAVVAIQDAIAAGVSGKKIEQAQRFLAKGDAVVADRKCSNAIEDYRKAWKRAARDPSFPRN